MDNKIGIKKRLSVDLYKIVNRSLIEHPDLVTIVDHDKSDLYIIDKDKNSDFFFSVTKEAVEKDGQLYIEFTCKPLSNIHKTTGSKKKKIGEFENLFKEWLNNLEVYKEKSPMDDLILNGYQEEFLNDFKIVDDDADERGFGFQQQLKISQYLQTVVDNIDEYKTEANTHLIDQLKLEAENLQAEITTETKNGTIKRLSRIWAKARKGGLKVGEFMIKEFAKEFLKEGAKALFNFASTNAGQLPSYIEHWTNSNHHLIS